MAAYLGYEFVDAAEESVLIKREIWDFREDRQTSEQSVFPKCENAVVPGFYGAKDDGTVTTFPEVVLM